MDDELWRRRYGEWEDEWYDHDRDDEWYGNHGWTDDGYRGPTDFPVTKDLILRAYYNSTNYPANGSELLSVLHVSARTPIKWICVEDYFYGPTPILSATAPIVIPNGVMLEFRDIDFRINAPVIENHGTISIDGSTLTLNGVTLLNGVAFQSHGGLWLHSHDNDMSELRLTNSSIHNHGSILLTGVTSISVGQNSTLDLTNGHLGVSYWYNRPEFAVHDILLWDSTSRIVLGNNSGFYATAAAGATQSMLTGTLTGGVPVMFFVWNSMLNGFEMADSH
jgi:hypothetical protein